MSRTSPQSATQQNGPPRRSRPGRLLSRIRAHRMLITVALLLAAYVTFFLLGGCADRFLLFPSRDPVDARTAMRKTIPFNDGELEAWVARSPGANGREPQAFVVVFGGNAARAEWDAWDATDWGEKPVEVWAVNHPGFGGSTGTAKLSRLPDAALTAYDHVSKHAAGRPVYVSGTSLGTTMAMHVAAHRPVAGAILRTPPALWQLIQREYGWWNLWVLSTPVAFGVPRELGSLSNANHCKAPAVFLLADNDEIVPVKYQRKVVQEYAGPKQVIIMKGSTHNAPLDARCRDQFREKLNWLWENRPQIAGK